ncbi:hypothetical protein PILCRDRAFT_819689 [Piloderma croceum F 1598]|uniref:Uncharacterized protein n=1 Tax=Piloderma croceum (strain F 1598) TaxID=765440 RepID=A0A0C3C1G1_PILCF|nr:hypothetical protein PILCRDRAFT_819689 [Piloderma croceum F 1598]
MDATLFNIKNRRYKRGPSRNSLDSRTLLSSSAKSIQTLRDGRSDSCRRSRYLNLADRTWSKMRRSELKTWQRLATLIRAYDAIAS